MAITVSQLFIYPIKSCAFNFMPSFVVDEFGPVYDRHWVVIDKDNRFLTQRQLPKMSLIFPEIKATTLKISVGAMSSSESIEIPLQSNGKDISVSIWEDITSGIDCGDEVSNFLSKYLGLPCRLAQKGPKHTRKVKNRFADGYPFLLLSQESMDDLNKRLPEPLPALRFRPNIIVKGCRKPYEEDAWVQFLIGNVQFERVKDCARCPITTVDYKRGVFKGPEPLKTLATYRRGEKNKVLFAQNLIHRSTGKIHVGDIITD